LLRRRRAGNDGSRPFRVFYASDLHGSDLAWRKFLSAGRVHEAPALVMGGDLTGKAIVAIEQRESGPATARFQGRNHVLHGDSELEAFEANVRINGFYPYRCDEAELERMRSDPQHVSDVFRMLMTQTLKNWIELADERLDGTGVKLFVMPGNDDEFYLDEIIAGRHVENCDGRRVQVGEYPMFSLGWATTTPWDTPRETTEADLWERIVGLLDGTTDFSRAIFNFHEPPFDSGLDLGPALTDDLEVIQEAGQPKQVPIGSHSVRRAIEEFQPLLALHGHVHESRGATKIGRTTCINPGSRYSEGVVDGAVITLVGDSVRSYQLVTG
jgi:Icc-related predicted phosphoesterase